MSENLENLAVATGLEKVSFHSNLKKGQCQRMFKLPYSWKRLWCWEGLGARGEGDNRGWDGWMASLTRWTWVSVNSGSWWWTGRPGGLRFMGSQRVGHDWATDLIWSTHFTSKKGNVKILHARLQQYMNRELPCVQAGFRKGRGARDQIANLYWFTEKAR